MLVRTFARFGQKFAGELFRARADERPSRESSLALVVVRRSFANETDERKRKTGELRLVAIIASLL